MGCERCGGRMLSRGTGSRQGLVCSDCGTPVVRVRREGRPHPLTTSSVMLGLAAFSALLFFLTNWRPTAPKHKSERGWINRVTTGAFVKDAKLLEKGGHTSEDE